MSMGRHRIYQLVWVLGGILLAVSLCVDGALAQTCEPWIAKAVSVQGSVQCLRAGEREWRPVALNDLLCPGDMVRILKMSRADIILSNNAILRLDQNTTVAFSKPEEDITFPIRLLKGAAYFFSRIRRSLKLFTPFVNAIIEGTEFYARVESDKAVLSIFEGRVNLSNPAGAITLARGQSAVAEADRPPVLYPVVRLRDAVQWTLYYPPVLYYRPDEFRGITAEWANRVRKSIGFYERGDISKALAILEGAAEDIRDPRFFTYRASLLLFVGRVDDARMDIEKALQLMPGNSDAIALQAVIAVARNERGKALDLAKKAVEGNPHSASARIALSYALQANFDLRGALASLKEAVKLEPENALAWARLAELRLSFGELKQALKAAKRAASLNPDLARTQTVLGFAYLMQIDTKRSKEAFLKAIKLDQADPLQRLGLGLAMIREGDMGEGRKEIEIAASLDPDNSLIRSYLGKAYYEEKRDSLASRQFELAEKLDPLDPTPFFYDAILKQSVNQPVEALHDLQKSIALNDNRIVYRSRLLLDSDLAARSASIARIYTDLGFQQRALVEGWKSVNTDPANFSAHRFLAEAYLAQPRHEIARVSEVLQTLLLQPININPVPPLMAESNLSFLSGAGPTDLSFNEYNPLFNRNRFALQASGIAGEHDTYGDEIVQSGLWGKFSYSLGQFYYQTDGWRENNDLKNNIYDVFGQYSLSERTSVQAELRSTEVKKGDLTLRFFPDDFLPNLRDETKTKSVRLGFHHAFSPRSDLIGYAMYQDAENEVRFQPVPYFGIKFKTNSDNYDGELQHLFRSQPFNLVSGVGYFHINRREVDTFTSLGISTPTNTEVNHTNLYIYSQINYLEPFSLTVGGSADFFRGGIIDRDQFNPKLGLTWSLFPGTVIRGAVFRTFKRTLLTNQTLEPTQVAGFNQFFDDVEGTESWRYGLAVDQKFTKNIYGGIEISKRDLEVPFSTFAGLVSVVKKVDWEESLGRAYFYWIPHRWMALNAEYQYEEMKRDSSFTANTAEEVKTHRVPLGISLFHPSGLIAKLKATYIHQEGEFQPQGSLPGVSIPGEDDFWTVDASVGYRLPKRYGIISLEARNLFDKSFRYQDTDPASPMIQPERMVLLKVTLSF
jgi:tetratricopeptide (TPR) repeat protein